MLPEEKAREKIDKQLRNAGWDIVSRDEYVPQSASAVKEALKKNCSSPQFMIHFERNSSSIVV